MWYEMNKEEYYYFKKLCFRKLKKIKIRLTVKQVSLIDIYRPLHLKLQDTHFFSNSLGKFSMTDLVLGEKTTLNKFKILKLY